MNATTAVFPFPARERTNRLRPAKAVSKVEKSREADSLPPFDQVVEEYYQGLYRFALSLSRKEEDAVDLVQQAFLIFARKGSQIRDPSKVKSWLFTTLYREFLALKRRHDRFSGLEIEEIRDEPALQKEDGMTRYLDARIILGAIDDLDPIFREPLVLFYVDDSSYKEIAAVLDLPQGTVMSRLSRGKALLRKRLRTWETENGNRHG